MPRVDEQAAQPDNVIQLGACGRAVIERQLTDEDWARYEGYVGEIFAALGMDLDTPGTHDTPRRFLEALYDATSGYEGDPKLLTAFPAEGRGGPDSLTSQVIEGPISFQ